MFFIKFGFDRQGVAVAGDSVNPPPLIKCDCSRAMEKRANGKPRIH